MKKLFTLFLAIGLIGPAIASSILNPTPMNTTPVKASEIKIPIAKGKMISVLDLAYIKVADYEKVTGKKMTFVKKIQFKLAQRKLRKSINEDGTFNNKKLEKVFQDEMSGTTGFHLGGFALGLFLFVIGVLIAYLIDDEKKSNRVKWAWIGAAVSLLFGIFFIF
jgi:hypothetical protein